MISEVKSVPSFKERFQGANPGKGSKPVKVPVEPIHHFLIADEHPIFREGVGRVIASGFECHGITEAADMDGVLEIVSKKQDLSLILLDMDIPGMYGLDGLIRLRNEAPAVPVVIVSAKENKQLALKAIACGAVGYITKSLSGAAMSSAIHQVLNGKVYLQLHSDIGYTVSEQRMDRRCADQKTEYADLIATLTGRQLLVFQRMGKGESNKQIAHHLNISECTVKAHVSAILRKLGVYNRLQAVLCAGEIDIIRFLARQGLFEPETMHRRAD